MVPRADDEILAAEYLRYVALCAKAIDWQDWNASNPLHPRDQWGRFISVGGEFELPAPTADFVQGAVTQGRMSLRPELAKLRTKAKVEQLLREHLSAKLGHDVQVDLGRRMHLQTMKEVSEGLMRGAEDWPNARLHRISTARRIPGPAPDAWAATTEGANGVEAIFNERQFGNRSRFLSKLRRTVDAGVARPSQDNAAYVAAHEFGHVITNFTVRKGDPMVAAALRQMEADGVDLNNDADIADYMRRQLGDYALHSPSEMIAEAYADVQLNGGHASPLAKAIVAQLVDEYNAVPGSSRAPGVGRAQVPDVPVAAPIVDVPAGPAARFHRNLDGIEDLADAVENRKMVHDESLAGGVCGDTRLRQYDNGVEVVYKRDTGFFGFGPKHAADAEQLASVLARAIGVRAPRIYRNSEDEIHMEFLGNAKVAKSANERDVMSVIQSKQGHLVGLLDIMISNHDRHAGNWMLGPRGEPIVIDHGLGFGRIHDRPKDVYRNIAFSSPFASDFSRAMEAGRVDLKQIEQLRRKIEDVRPEFELLGRRDWHDFALTMFDHVIDAAR